MRCRPRQFLVLSMIVTMSGWWMASAASAKTIAVKNGQSIQAAVDRAKSGDTIQVGRGTYAENVEITTDNLHLVGDHATIVPPKAARAASKCYDPTDPTSLNGVCIFASDADLANNSPGSGISGVEVRGLTIKGFPGTGVLALGGKGIKIKSNKLIDDSAYGAAAFSSTGTEMSSNSYTTTKTAEAGYYIGDSPDANAKVINNSAKGARSGVFVRAASGADIERNTLTGNCIGVLILGDAPNAAGNSKLIGNTITANNKFCPADTGPEGFPAVSGIGIAVINATGNVAHRNKVTGNKASQPSQFSGGLVLAKGPGSTVPADNDLTSNTVTGNQPDISSDGTGTGNQFTNDHCKTSTPPGLCT